MFLIVLMLGMGAMLDADYFESPLFPPHSRSHQQSRVRASRTARVDVDHAIEHIDDEHHTNAQANAGHQLVGVAAEAITVAAPAWSSEPVVCLSLETPSARAVYVRAGRGPPTLFS